MVIATRILKFLVALYFLIALRSLGQEVYNGGATLYTYVQIAADLVCIGWCISTFKGKKLEMAQSPEGTPK